MTQPCAFRKCFYFSKSFNLARSMHGEMYVLISTCYLLLSTCYLLISTCYLLYARYARTPRFLGSYALILEKNTLFVLLHKKSKNWRESGIWNLKNFNNSKNFSARILCAHWTLACCPHLTLKFLEIYEASASKSPEMDG
jgi:hypothetical protein